MALLVFALTVAEIGSSNSIREDNLEQRISTSIPQSLQLVSATNELVTTCDEVCRLHGLVCASKTKYLYVGWQIKPGGTSFDPPLDCDTIFDNNPISNPPYAGRVVCQCEEA